MGLKLSAAEGVRHMMISISGEYFDSLSADIPPSCLSGLPKILLKACERAWHWQVYGSFAQWCRDTVFVHDDSCVDSNFTVVVYT
jgi:hypothetical protein